MASGSDLTNSRSNSLVEERQRNIQAAQIIEHRFFGGEIDIDDSIEELRPLRMRNYAINCQLIEMAEDKTTQT